MFMTHMPSAELTKPGVGALHDPAASQAAYLSLVFIVPPLVVLAVVRNQRNSRPLHSRS